MQKKLIRNLKAIVLICVFVLIYSNYANAQLLENKLTVYASFSNLSNHGDSFVNYNDLISPSLFSNFNQNMGIQITGTYKVKPWLATGILLQSNRSSDWVLDGSFLYNGSGADFVFMAPVIRFYSQNKKLGFLNRFSVYAELAAGTGQANIELITPIMHVENGGNIRLTRSESAGYWGFAARLGARFDINHMGGFHISYALHRNRIDGVLFNDRALNTSQIEAGIHFRFLENKRFYN